MFHSLFFSFFFFIIPTSFPHDSSVPADENLYRFLSPSNPFHLRTRRMRRQWFSEATNTCTHTHSEWLIQVNLRNSACLAGKHSPRVLAQVRSYGAAPVQDTRSVFLVCPTKPQQVNLLCKEWQGSPRKSRQVSINQSSNRITRKSSHQRQRHVLLRVCSTKP
ncbi:hypothetical protein HOY82DRAFT_339047 [Tuber indicum]|nr:hypothetical protein HOY82DRAFT_339047 [Tuber indicum]